MVSEEACFAFFFMLDLTFSPFRTSSAKFAAPLITAFFTVRRMLWPVSLFASFIALGTSFFAPCARSFPNHLIKCWKSENYKKFSFCLKTPPIPEPNCGWNLELTPFPKISLLCRQKDILLTLLFCYRSNIFQRPQIISNQITCEMWQKISDARFS